MTSRESNPPQCAGLPDPHLYEDEYRYWPWGNALAIVEEWTVSKTARSSMVLDYMCGTGFLLGRIATARPDLALFGCDISQEYIEYGRSTHPGIQLVVGDALRYRPERRPDVVLCTAGLHHLAPAAQPQFLAKVVSELTAGDYLIFADEVIAPYHTETERRLAALEMTTALAAYVTRMSPPAAVAEAAIDLIKREYFRVGEYKISLAELTELLERSFVIERTHKVWPDVSSPFGDFVFVCRKR